MQDINEELAMIRKIKHELKKTNNQELLSEIVSHNKHIKTNLDNIRALKYPIIEIVQEGSLHVLKQFPYCFDDFLNPNFELLKVNKFTQ
jgi:hypothetical protein